MSNVEDLARFARRANPSEKPIGDNLFSSVEAVWDRVQDREIAGMLLDAIPGIFFLVDTRYRIRLWNRRLQKLTGFKSEKIIRMSVLDLFDDSDRVEMELALEKCLIEEQSTVDTSVVIEEGSSPLHHFQNQLVELDGEQMIACVAMDVSRLKEVEAEHARQRVQLERLASHVPGTVYQLQRDHDTGRLWFPYASAKFHQVFGMDYADVAEDASPLIDRIHGADSDRVMQALERSAETMKPFFQELRMYPVGRARTDDAIEWIEIDSGPEKLSDGSVVWHGFARLVTHRRQLERKLTQLAYFDELTGLPNRANLQSTLRDELTAAVSAREGLAVLYLDLDNFNDINDAWSHAAGDRLLKEVGERLKSLVDGEGMLGRIGGDEFLVILRGQRVREQAEALGEAICDTMNAPMHLGDRQVRMTMSIGISMFPCDAETAEDLIRHADAAVYNAKSQGPGRVGRYSRELTEAARARRYLETELRTAIEGEQIQVALQPIVSLEDGKTVAVEALARWYHWEDGWLSPDRFVAMAEKRGLIGALGEQVYRRAMQAVADMPGITLALNVAPGQLQDSSFARRLVDLAQDCGLGAERIEVELTERAFLGDGTLALDQIDRLRYAGINVSIDDFGSGFSSLGYLRRLPAQRLKIDRMFVRQIENDPASAAIVRAVTSLAHDLGMEVTAEGVETANEAEFVRSVGCDYAQGWYYGRPDLVE
ncbi:MULTISPECIES: EAL domain-containing protein [unclassified Wenzhouxiangella]|uniref:sensor domain-containing protein n=1 Tax=unclassified Wenzhouxiangella TaxID=2613841 RepID=UPI0015F26C70|nr:MULTISPECIES: EAL domain-containing protein [unclassified Wenzhouxiangella]